MKFRKYILLFLFVSFCFADCKKYKEDNFFTFHKPIARLRGSWDLVSVTVNGVDSTQQFKQSDRCGCDLNFDDNTSTWKIRATSCISNAGCSTNGEFGLDDKKNLRLEGFLVYPAKDEFLTHYILKLYKKDLKFKVTHPDSGKEYVFVYKKY